MSALPRIRKYIIKKKKKTLEGVRIMFLGINIFTVTESESSGPKSSQRLKH